jgi:hypothetical protein
VLSQPERNTRVPSGPGAASHGGDWSLSQNERVRMMIMPRWRKAR